MQQFTNQSVYTFLKYENTAVISLEHLKSNDSIKTFIIYSVKHNIAESIDRGSSCTKNMSSSHGQKLVGTIQPGQKKLLVLSLHGARQQSWELQGILITTYSSVVVSLDLTHIHMTFILQQKYQKEIVIKYNCGYLYCWLWTHYIFSNQSQTMSSRIFW